MQVAIRNARGQFAPLNAKPLVSEAGLARLKAARALVESARPDLLAAADVWIEAAEAAPQARVEEQWRQFDLREAPAGADVRLRKPKTAVFTLAEAPARVWFAPGAFRGGPQGKASPCAKDATPEGLGWTSASALATVHAQACELAWLLAINAPHVSGVKRAMGLAGRGCSIERSAPSEGLCEGEFWGIFIAPRNGWLDRKGGVGVSGFRDARWFKSAEAASRTIREAKVEGAVVAKILARVTDARADGQSAIDLGLLEEGVARAEARQIRDAARAGGDNGLSARQLRERIDELRARLAEIEGGARALGSKNASIRRV
jgi:hypothetical protein